MSKNGTDWTPIILIAAIAGGAYLLLSKFKDIGETVKNTVLPETPNIKTPEGDTLIPSYSWPDTINPMRFAFNVGIPSAKNISDHFNLDEIFKYYPTNPLNWKNYFDLLNRSGKTKPKKPTYYEKMTPEQRAISNIPVPIARRIITRPKEQKKAIEKTFQTGRVQTAPLQTQSQAARVIHKVITGSTPTKKGIKQGMASDAKKRINPQLRKLMGI